VVVCIFFIGYKIAQTMADLLRLARGSLFEIAGVLIYESMLYKIEAEN
jgi:hypothetical protein